MIFCRDKDEQLDSFSSHSQADLNHMLQQACNNDIGYVLMHSKQDDDNLFEAVMVAQFDAIAKLIAQGADPSSIDHDTAFYMANDPEDLILNAVRF